MGTLNSTRSWFPFLVLTREPSLHKIFYTTAIKVYDSNEYIPEFVFWYMQFIYYQFTAISKNKFKMASLSFLKELEIYQVPITLQSQFAAFVQQVENLRSSLQQSLTELENNFNSLMQKAFNGEVIA